jgi:phospholipid/cholesterol/gamma-HCH transport system ATP-binding protein
MKEIENNTVIEIQNLEFYRGNRAIFKGVSLNIQKGKVTAILGPSGTGKTTLLHLIGGLIRPHAGEVHVLKENVNTMGSKKIFKLRQKMGMLFQSGALFTDLSVYDNVAFPLREHTCLPESMIRSIVMMKLQAVGLRGAMNLMPSQLSGGMSRRAALARAVSLDPQIMMYDEPFTGQDPISMGVVVKLVRLLNDALKLTSVIVSHDVQEVLSIADYVYIIAGGKVIGEGSPSEILKSKNPEVEQFIHGRPDGPVPFHYPSASIHDDFLRGI